MLVLKMDANSIYSGQFKATTSDGDDEDDEGDDNDCGVCILL